METPSYVDLEYEVADHIATITLNRPDRLNALSPGMRIGLHDALVRSDADDDVRVIIITGAGRGFCSGGDVKAMNEAREAAAASGADFAARTSIEDKIAPSRDQVVLAMREATKPVIAAVNGAAAGAGMNLALACDIRIGSTAARFGQTFSRRGLHPDWGGTYFLPRIVGVAKAAELTWSGRMVDADEALALGIVSQITEPDELLVATREMAAGFVAGPPVAIRLAKRAMYRSLDSSLREALEFETYAQQVCQGTADAAEGIKAFVDKREPEFKGH